MQIKNNVYHLIHIGVAAYLKDEKTSISKDVKTRKLQHTVDRNVN
jgi:hypothetical protein